MCLGIPAQIIEKQENNVAIVDVQSIKQKVNTTLVDVAVGDWVLVHAGFAINVIDEEEAQETLSILKQMDAF